MKKTPVDATDVARKALLGIEDGWYEAYWYTGSAEARLRLPARLAGQVAIASRAIRRPGGRSPVRGHRDRSGPVSLADQCSGQ
jgi:hypothetical protein